MLSLEILLAAAVLCLAGVIASFFFEKGRVLIWLIVLLWAYVYGLALTDAPKRGAAHVKTPSPTTTSPTTSPATPHHDND